MLLHCMYKSCSMHYRSHLCVLFPSMANVLPSLALSPEDVNEEEVTVQEKEKMINISYELAAEASKRSKLVAGMSAGTTDTRRGITLKKCMDLSKNWWEDVLRHKLSASISN